jgi:ascorbate-specific PTS system EIIC-type component UlaA
MKKYKTFEDWIPFIVATIFGFGLIVFGTGMIMNTFKEVPEQTINFNITGITNSTNSSSLTSLHFECIKFCTDNYYSRGDSTRMTKCYEQCASLGKELL